MAKKNANNQVQDEEHIKSLYSTYAASIAALDKNCLYIASGAFTLSFAFITDIVKLECAKQKDLLITSWAVFISVMFIGLVGHFLSTVANMKAIKFAYLNADAFNDKIKWWNRIIQALNILSILSLLIACLLLVSFINYNI